MQMRMLTAPLLLLASVATAHASDASAGRTEQSVRARGECPLASGSAVDGPEESGVGLGIVLDEHLLTNGARDQDYNGGGEVTLPGRRKGLLGRSLDRALGFLDARVCSVLPGGPALAPTHAFAAGLLVFTPGALEAREIVRGDRPYASLFFISSGRRYAAANAQVAYDSTLTFGMLGLAAAHTVQQALHHATASAQPEGWAHQVSSGGEPTMRYNLARQALLGSYQLSGLKGDGKWTLAGSAGTVTETSLALSMRLGRVESPWWAFTPEENMYVQETQPLPPALAADAPAEVFAFAGARLKLRAYNAFLQGQFRHSDLRYHEGDLNPALGEAWVGVEVRTSSGWAVQYLARWESQEMRRGVGSRSFVWGSVNVVKAFR